MAIISIGLMIGSLVLSLTENGYAGALAPIATEPEIVYELDPYGTPRSEVGSTQKPQIRREFATAVIGTPTSSCPPKLGWRIHIVLPGDTLNTLAEQFGIPVEQLLIGNCLTVSDLVIFPGMILNVPVDAATSTPVSPSITMTSTAAITTGTRGFCTPTKQYACSRPAGWIIYSVRSGDTLYGLSRAVGSTVDAIQSANCMGNTTLIRTGDQIFLPRFPIFTLVPTFTRWPTPTIYYPPTQIPTLSSTPVVPTATPITPTYTHIFTATSAPATPTQPVPPTEPIAPPPTDTEPAPATDTISPPPPIVETPVQPLAPITTVTP